MLGSGHAGNVRRARVFQDGFFKPTREDMGIENFLSRRYTQPNSFIKDFLAFLSRILFI